MEKIPKVESTLSVIASGLGHVVFKGLDLVYNGLRGGGWAEQPKGIDR